MEPTVGTFLLVCPLLFVAGVVDSIAGGGGLISLPAYLMAGLPPHMATATNKCSSTLGTIVSMAKFIKDGRCHKRAVVAASATAMAGSAIGSRLNLVIDDAVLQYILAVLLPVIAVILLFNRDFGRELNTERLTGKTLGVVAAIIGLFIGVYDGFFGPGTGTFLMLAFTAVCGFDLMTASGSAKVVNLFSNIAAFVSFIVAGTVVWVVGIPAALCCTAGHYVGSSLAIKNGTKIIRPMIFIVLSLLLIHVFTNIL